MVKFYGKVSNHVHCQNGANCDGPGCKVHTGKTARKRNGMSGVTMDELMVPYTYCAERGEWVK